MIVRRARVLGVVAVLVAACTSPRADEVPAGPEPSANTVAARLGDTLRVMRGQTGTVDAGRISIRFDSAGPDSRCKKGVQCVWAGDISATLVTKSGSTDATVTLHTNLDPSVATINDYRIELLTVDPYPGTEPPNARLAQVAVLRVTRS